MSIRGLYDSEVGDQMARKTFAPFCKHELAKGTRPRRLCVCGNTIAFPHVVRGGSYVCKQCAIDIPRLRGGRTALHKCVKCKKLTGRVNFVLRKGKLYCKSCAKDF